MSYFPMLQTSVKTCVAKTVTVNVFAVVECPEKSLKIVFMKGKQLNVVTAVNGFTEFVNESQMLCSQKTFKA